MGSDYKKQLRFVDKMHNRSNDEELLRAKVQKCYLTIKNLVDVEIEKNHLNMYDAINKVLNNSALQRLHPELAELVVKTKVRSLLINYYINKDKTNQNQR